MKDDTTIVDDLAGAIVDDLAHVHATRENWLTAATESLRPMFQTAGFPLAQAIRVACGFPSTANRSGAVGETWAATASRDATVEVLISPVLDDPREVLAVLVAQLAHAADGALKFGAPYRAAVTAMGLEPLRKDYKSTRPNQAFDSLYSNLLSELGVYPHAALVPTNLRPKQSTRMLKAVCTHCDYTIRLTSKWANKGLPTCVCSGDFKLAQE